VAHAAPRAMTRRIAPLCVAIVALLFFAPAQALRVVDYNILNYPGSSGAARAPYYRTVLGPLDADVIVTEEMASPTGPTQFLNEVLNVLEPGEWATVPFIDGNDTDASLFYKPAKVQFLEQSAFYPNPANHLRYVHVYRVMPVGYASPAAELRIYTAHLKASTGYESQRLAECVGIRDHLNAMPQGTHAMLCGDLNFYTQSAEPGYAKLCESQSNNIGRLYDMLPAGEWHDSPSLAPYHTQSPCRTGACASGGATGGLDDRFDFVLPTLSLGTGQGLAVIPGTCISVGNDGEHLNLSITEGPVIPEGEAYASAIQLASDHLPVRVDLQLPAKIAADAALAFPTVIVGAPAQTRTLVVGNPALEPADALDCVFAPPAGYGAPATLAVAPGASEPATITMGTASAGPRDGSLTILSDAPDNPSLPVGLTGAVLDHAAASLDSLAVVLTEAVDFGDHEAGAFTPQSVRVFNTGYDLYQARLSVEAADVAGGDGRFALVEGLDGPLVAGTGRDFVLTFDAAGAVLDSTYDATLTLASADEPLPGALAQPDLVVSLRARVTSVSSGAGPTPVAIATRLYEPSPNPLMGMTTLRLDLARAVDANVAVYDPAGRCLAILHRGALAPGRHTLSWDGRTTSGALLGSGAYFVRFSAPGLRAQTARVVVVR
jgi:hypothetical protein